MHGTKRWFCFEHLCILLIFSLISINSRHELKKTFVNIFLINFSIIASLAVLMDLTFNEKHFINISDHKSCHCTTCYRHSTTIGVLWNVKRNLYLFWYDIFSMNILQNSKQFLASLILSKAALQRCSCKWCSGNIQQVYRRTHMLKSDFNKVAS